MNLCRTPPPPPSLKYVSGVPGMDRFEAAARHAYIYIYIFFRSAGGKLIMPLSILYGKGATSIHHFTLYLLVIKLVACMEVPFS